MLFQFNKNKKNRYSMVFFCWLIILFLLNNRSSNKEVDNIFIIIHGVWVYSWDSLLFEFRQKPLINGRWNLVKNKKAEQKGLIDITNIDNPEEFLERERSIIKYKKENSQLYHYAKYYKYNWDGFLSEKSRNNAGKILAKELLLLREKYPNSKIHIIGYSHGGNVALNTVKYLPKNSTLVIDELILFASPIGKITEELASRKNSNREYYFKKIFSIYSQADSTQIKDFLFNFPQCHRFLEKRSENVFIIECKYSYYDQIKNKNIVYLPDHKDFVIEFEKKLIQGKYYTYLPIICYLPEIINSKKKLINSNIKKINSHHSIYLLPLLELCSYNDKNQ
jgi:hypothetical protein